MTANIIISLLLLFACLSMLYICLQLHAAPARRSSQRINQNSRTRSTTFKAEKPFRGRFRDIPSYQHTPRITPHGTDAHQHALCTKHLATMGFSHMPEPHLLLTTYKRLAAKWHPEIYDTPTYSDFERARARAKFTELNKAYKWLMHNAL